MEFGALKPLLTSLVMPLGSLLLLVVAGLVLSIRHKRTGLLVSLLAAISLWLLSTQAVAVWLAAHVLPQYSVVTPAQIKASQVQAIVILGRAQTGLQAFY